MSYLSALRSLFAFLVASLAYAANPSAPDSVRQWDVYELQLQGPAEGNPFVEVRISAVFTHLERSVEIEGFYDGGGVYRVRFMPEVQGDWSYETRSNRWKLTGKRGAFKVTAPEASNHGPVHVRNTFHFAYADGTPYRQVGTTCYSWQHRTELMEQATLSTLAASPFNKIRMCVFPQDHATDSVPPPHFPYEGTAPQAWDFTRFNPAFFQHLEQRVADLGKLGIEADLILFHPYGKTWNFDSMDRESDDRYLRYLVARLSAYRNVWWSVANEYDFLRTKTEADMDHYGRLLKACDPYNHLRSIHNGYTIFDQNQSWITHASVQNGAAVEDVRSAQLYRDVWRKPVVFDEVKYEGNSASRWGQLSAKELVHRFWCGTVGGTYVGHSECLERPDSVIWLGQGVALHGESPARLAFLRKVMEAGPVEGIEPVDKWQRPYMGGKAGDYYLLYFGHEAPTSWVFQLYKANMAEGLSYTVEILDTWNMTVTPVEGIFTTKKKDNYHFVDLNGRSVTLPGREGIALRIRRVDTATRLPVSGPPTE